MSVSQSIFGVWRHLRALHALTGHHARNAPKTSRYCGLQGPFWRYFWPKSPLRWTPIRRSRVVFRHNIPDSDEFSPQNHVNNHCEWPNIVSEARIEPLFVENGKKLTSVDQKLVMVMMWWFLTRFNIFFSVELWIWYLLISQQNFRKTSIQISDGENSLMRKFLWKNLNATQSSQTVHEHSRLRLLY